MFVDSLIEYTSVPNCVFTIESGVVEGVGKCRLITFKHVSLWCLSFDPHLTTHRSNIGV